MQGEKREDDKIRIRYLFIGLFFFLPLQYLVVGGVSFLDQEPWPAFVMPGFKTVHVENRKYTVPKTEFTLYDMQGMPVLKLRPHEFLRGIPRSQVLGVVDQLMKDEERIERLRPETIEWMHKNGEEIAGVPLSYIEISKHIRFYSRDRGNMRLRVDSLSEEFSAEIRFNGNE